MLRKHLYCLIGSNERINVFMQSVHKLFKSPFVLIIVCYQSLETFDMSFGNLCHILCPLFPIAFIANFLNHSGKKNTL